MKTKRALILVAVLGLSVGQTACKRKPEAGASDDAGAPIASVEPKATAVAPKPLPPEPPPPLAGEYDGGALQTFADLTAKHAALKDIWEPARRDHLRALLSVLSTMLETLEPDGNSELSLPMWKKAQGLKLDAAAVALSQHIAFTGKLPDDFVTAMGKHLGAVKTELHLGTWKAPEKAGDVGFDLSALAAWMNREDPAYLREHIAARSKGGTAPWPRPRKAPPVHIWLAWEDYAIARLGMQLRRQGADLAPEEMARLKFLSDSPLGSPGMTVDVELADLLGAYKNNEVRADSEYKGKVVRVAGVATDIKKNVADNVYMVLSTGPRWTTPDVHCRVGKAMESKASEVDKGARVVVRGKVSGMVLTSVILDSCEIED